MLQFHATRGGGPDPDVVVAFVTPRVFFTYVGMVTVYKDVLVTTGQQRLKTYRE